MASCLIEFANIVEFAKQEHVNISDITVSQIFIIFIRNVSWWALCLSKLY